MSEESLAFLLGLVIGALVSTWGIWLGRKLEREKRELDS